MKKTIATSLLLILIFSCVFSFIACTDNDEPNNNKPIDPLVGCYKSTSFSDSFGNNTFDAVYDEYFKVNNDNTAIHYLTPINSRTIYRQTNYSWSYNEETKEYEFIDLDSKAQPKPTYKYILTDDGHSLIPITPNYQKDYFLEYERYDEGYDWLK